MILLRKNFSIKGRVLEAKKKDNTDRFIKRKNNQEILTQYNDEFSEISNCFMHKVLKEIEETLVYLLQFNK